MKKLLLFTVATSLLFISAKGTLFSSAAPENGITYINQTGNGLPFSKAVRAGDMVYLSGMIGAGADGKLIPGFDAQAKQTMDNIAAILKSQGLSMSNVVKCTVMIHDMANYNAFNNIYKTYFSKDHYPARSAFGANGLAFGADLEVEVITYDPKK
ncbi:MAG: RidA family protein [Mucilaginibacter sp.]